MNAPLQQPLPLPGLAPAEQRKRTVKPDEIDAPATKAEVAENQLARPRCRADCVEVERPCPYVGCKFNNYLDVSPTGNVILNFPDREPEDMDPDWSCALDIAEDGGHNGATISRALNLTRERVRQIVQRACIKIVTSPARRGALEDFWPVPSSDKVPDHLRVLYERWKRNGKQGRKKRRDKATETGRHPDLGLVEGSGGASNWETGGTAGAQP